MCKLITDVMVLNRDEQRGELGNQRQQVFFWGLREADSEPGESSLRLRGVMCYLPLEVSRGAYFTEGTYFRIYYPPEVRRRKYLGLGVFLLQYCPLVKIYIILHHNCVNMNIVG